ncbi:hypothetical protein Tco_0190111 [Tanacetum coccineum]
MRQRCTSGDDHQYQIDQMQNFLKNDIVWESIKEILSLPYLQKPTPVVQSCQRDPKALALSLNPHAQIFYIKRQKEPGKPIEEVYSNLKIVQVIKTTGELGHEYKFVTEIITRRANGSIVDDYAETGLLWSLSVFIRSIVIWKRVHDFQLGVESYQHKVNLTVPSITFPGIKKKKMFSIVSEPIYGIIYKSSKKEKRVMRHQEINKFCDATLKRVLEGLKRYNDDVKHGYVTPSLSKKDAEYLQLFKEEIIERLRHQDQIRCWEITPIRRKGQGKGFMQKGKFMVNPPKPKKKKIQFQGVQEQSPLLISCCNIKMKLLNMLRSLIWKKLRKEKLNEEANNGMLELCATLESSDHSDSYDSSNDDKTESERDSDHENSYNDSEHGDESDKSDSDKESDESENDKSDKDYVDVDDQTAKFMIKPHDKEPEQPPKELQIQSPSVSRTSAEDFTRYLNDPNEVQMSELLNEPLYNEDTTKTVTSLLETIQETQEHPAKNVTRLTNLEQGNNAEAIEELIQANVINEVNNQLLKFLPKAVYGYAKHRLERTVLDVMKKNPITLFKSSSTLIVRGRKAKGEGKKMLVGLCPRKVKLKMNLHTMKEVMMLKNQDMKGCWERSIRSGGGALIQESVKLEYNIEQCHLALTYKIAWTNPKGNKFHHNLSKPLSLVGPPGRKKIPISYFFNHDLKYLKIGTKEKTYALLVTKIKAARYEDERIEEIIPCLWIPSVQKYNRDADVQSITFNKKYGYAYMEEIENKIHKDSQHQWRVMFKKRVDDVQLGIMYEGTNDRKRPMRADELHKFSFGTLNKVYNKLEVIL